MDSDYRWSRSANEHRFCSAALGMTRCMSKPDEEAEVSRDRIAAGGKV